MAEHEPSVPIPQEAESVEPTIQVTKEEQRKKENQRFLAILILICAVFVGVALYLFYFT